MTSRNIKFRGFTLVVAILAISATLWIHQGGRYYFIATVAKPDIRSLRNSHDTEVSVVEPDLSLRISQETQVCTKGNFQLLKSWLIDQLSDFMRVYNERPFVSNAGGTKVMHHFALWSTIKRLRPEYIIESGIYQGFGTWMMRQAAPNARFILLDPSDKNLKYRDKRNASVYLIGREFIDFGRVDWAKYVSDPARALVFIDDHQGLLLRIRQARQHGFKHLIFDDNYWMDSGDVTGLKTICHFVLGETLAKTSRYEAPEPGTQTVPRVWTEELRDELGNFFRKNITEYYEFPMIWNATRVLGRYTNKQTRNMLFNSTDGSKVLKDYGLTKTIPPGEIDTYRNIAYIKVE